MHTLGEALRLQKIVEFNYPSTEVQQKFLHLPNYEVLGIIMLVTAFYIFIYYLPKYKLNI